MGFSRAAAALRELLVKGLRVPLGNYFDDYPIIVPEDVDSLVRRAAAAFGFRRKEGEKDRPWASVLLLLGVQLDLRRVLSDGVVSVENTDKRRDSIIQQLRGFLSAPHNVPPAAAAALAGKLGFACGQVFGRCGLAAIGPIRRHGLGGNGCAPDPLFLHSCEWWVGFLANATPRHLPTRRPRAPLVIFSDGACEAGRVSFGATMYDPEDGAMDMWGDEATADLTIFCARVSATCRLSGRPSCCPSSGRGSRGRRDVSTGL